MTVMTTTVRFYDIHRSQLKAHMMATISLCKAAMTVALTCRIASNKLKTNPFITMFNNPQISKPCMLSINSQSQSNLLRS